MMDNHRLNRFIVRWWRATIRAIWSIRSLVTFIISFALAEIIWWVFFGLKVAWEQALEFFIPVFAGVIVAFIVTSVDQFSITRKLIQRERNQLQLTIQEQTSELAKISKWMSYEFTIAELRVTKVYLFGSVTHKEYENNDVDVLILFEEMEKKEYRINLDKIEKIENKFMKNFDKRLHLQRFLHDEKKGFQEFLSMQSEPVLVLEKNHE